MPWDSVAAHNICVRWEPCKPPTMPSRAAECRTLLSTKLGTCSLVDRKVRSSILRYELVAGCTRRRHSPATSRRDARTMREAQAQRMRLEVPASLRACVRCSSMCRACCTWPPRVPSASRLPVYSRSPKRSARSGAVRDGAKGREPQGSVRLGRLEGSQHDRETQPAGGSRGDARGAGEAGPSQKRPYAPQASEHAGAEGLLSRPRNAKAHTFLWRRHGVRGGKIG